ncbi:transposase-like protein [Runella defluvii]|uniref:Transposase-like protein n=1 Tax=Runella defluvii TaxID=370973 RepID=A0A7W6ETQ2_9BACT|nr:hypothetical protein [Runella defluvii]MBB3842009.1 transposase-like protein [Runella defluvii]
MSKHRKSWSETEIENILQHYQQHGITATVRLFNVASSMIYRWHWHSMRGEPKTEVQSGISQAEYHHLLRENQLLKELVAEKELEIRVKDALLKTCLSKQERLIIAQEFIDFPFPMCKVLAWCSVARSCFYYCSSIGLRGRKLYAVAKDGKVIDNEFIMKIIEQLDRIH